MTKLFILLAAAAFVLVIILVAAGDLLATYNAPAIYEAQARIAEARARVSEADAQRSIENTEELLAFLAPPVMALFVLMAVGVGALLVVWVRG